MVCIWLTALIYIFIGFPLANESVDPLKQTVPCPSCSKACLVRKVSKIGPNRGRGYFSCFGPGAGCKNFFKWQSEVPVNVKNEQNIRKDEISKNCKAPPSAPSNRIVIRRRTLSNGSVELLADEGEMLALSENLERSTPSQPDSSENHPAADLVKSVHNSTLRPSSFDRSFSASGQNVNSFVSVARPNAGLHAASQVQGSRNPISANALFADDEEPDQETLRCAIAMLGDCRPASQQARAQPNVKPPITPSSPNRASGMSGLQRSPGQASVEHQSVQQHARDTKLSPVFPASQELVDTESTASCPGRFVGGASEGQPPISAALRAFMLPFKPPRPARLNAPIGDTLTNHLPLRPFLQELTSANRVKIYPPLMRQEISEKDCVDLSEPQLSPVKAAAAASEFPQVRLGNSNEHSGKDNEGSADGLDGVPKSWLDQRTGPVLLGRGSKGSMHETEWCRQVDGSAQVTLQVCQAGWELQKCGVHSVGGIALLAVHAADVALEACHLGSPPCLLTFCPKRAGLVFGSDGGAVETPRASDAMVCMTNSTASLQDCIIEGAANMGILAHVGSSEVTMTGCVLRENFIAAGVDGASFLTIQTCRFEANLYAGIFVGEHAHKASVEVTDCKVHGRLWLGCVDLLHNCVDHDNSVVDGEGQNEDEVEMNHKCDVADAGLGENGAGIVAARAGVAAAVTASAGPFEDTAGDAEVFWGPMVTVGRHEEHQAPADPSIHVKHGTITENAPCSGQKRARPESPVGDSPPKARRLAGEGAMNVLPPEADDLVPLSVGASEAEIYGDGGDDAAKHEEVQKDASNGGGGEGFGEGNDAAQDNEIQVCIGGSASSGGRGGEGGRSGGFLAGTRSVPPPPPHIHAASRSLSCPPTSGPPPFHQAQRRVASVACAVSTAASSSPTEALPAGGCATSPEKTISGPDGEVPVQRRLFTSPLSPSGCG